MHFRQPLTVKRHSKAGLWSLLAVLLCSCSVAAPVATPPTAPAAVPATATIATASATPAPTATPTTSPQSTTAPATAAPTIVLPTPADTGVLPAPLFFLENGQIWRMDVDGQHRRQMTFEQLPVREFDLRPEDHALAYVVGSTDELSSTLVFLDAGGRTELLSGEIGSPLFRPHSDMISFQLIESIPGLIIGQDSAPTGVWGVSQQGGRPGLIQADDPPLPLDATPAAEPIDVNQYAPVAWSPDGSRLVMSQYPGYGEVAIGVIKQPDGSITPIDACCGPLVWTDDSASLFVSGGTWVQDSRLGLWRVDANTGQSIELLPGTINDEYALITAPHPAPGGAVDIFMTTAAEAPEVNPDAPGPLLMTRVTPDGQRTALRPADTYRIIYASWAPDGSGAVTTEEVPEGQPNRTYWLHADNRPAVALPTSGWPFHWGSNNPQAAPDACARFRTLAWQAASERRADSAVTELQQRLLALGYALGAADGYFGDQTRDAVSAFQQAHGLPATGALDCATWQALID